MMRGNDILNAAARHYLAQKKIGVSQQPDGFCVPVNTSRDILERSVQRHLACPRVPILSDAVIVGSSSSDTPFTAARSSETTRPPSNSGKSSK